MACITRHLDQYLIEGPVGSQARPSRTRSAGFTTLGLNCNNLGNGARKSGLRGVPGWGPGNPVPRSPADPSFPYVPAQDTSKAELTLKGFSPPAPRVSSDRGQTEEGDPKAEAPIRKLRLEGLDTEVCGSVGGCSRVRLFESSGGQRGRLQGWWEWMQFGDNWVVWRRSCSASRGGSLTRTPSPPAAPGEALGPGQRRIPQGRTARGQAETARSATGPAARSQPGASPGPPETAPGAGGHGLSPQSPICFHVARVEGDQLGSD